MGFFGTLRKLVSPPKLLTTRVNVREKPLYEQYQRIGGNVGPQQVSQILAAADMGQPAVLCDLFNESRQKDGHLQGICYTRDVAVGLCGLDFVELDDDKAKRKDKKAIALCRRIRDEFKDFGTLVDHLTGAYVPGHSTATLQWENTDDGLLVPRSAERLSARDFIFDRYGRLRYARFQGDTEGVDIVAENPGRVLQVQRRITGDVQVREGLIRCLVWAALLRNWSLKDWVALGEIGWKPWRLASYKKSTASQKDVDELVDMLERLGSTGVAVIPDSTELKIEWPKGMAPGTGGSSTHRELLDTMGREMSKAVLGQTTSAEPGPNGSRASDQVRDKVRTDIRETDAIADAATLYPMFRLAVAINIGPDVACPVPWFQTDESVDQLAFAQAVKSLADAKVRIPQKWIRDELGAPEPKDGEEVIGEAEPEPETDPNEPQPKPGEKPKPAPTKEAA